MVQSLHAGVRVLSFGLVGDPEEQSMFRVWAT